MPLRDHFRPPLDDLTSWDGFHGLWPSMLTVALSRRLPEGYVAAPHVHLGSSLEVDVATHEKPSANLPAAAAEEEEGDGGVATATWAPPRPTLAVATDLSLMDEYEVRVHDARRGRRLVAAVEIVSPSNKDRPEHRRAFVAKCATRLQDQVCVSVVDLVTTRGFNLYTELLDVFGLVDPALESGPPPLYAATCRLMERENRWRLEAWSHTLTLGQPLPTPPLWISESVAVPLELEPSYQETCRVLRIP